jgi:hypothetical protein
MTSDRLTALADDEAEIGARLNTVAHDTLEDEDDYIFKANQSCVSPPREETIRNGKYYILRGSREYRYMVEAYVRKVASATFYFINPIAQEQAVVIPKETAKAEQVVTVNNSGARRNTVEHDQHNEWHENTEELFKVDYPKYKATQANDLSDYTKTRINNILVAKKPEIESKLDQMISSLIVNQLNVLVESLILKYLGSEKHSLLLLKRAKKKAGDKLSTLIVRNTLVDSSYLEEKFKITRKQLEKLVKIGTVRPFKLGITYFYNLCEVINALNGRYV